ncbi:MAG: DUF2244 domain-containing protein [Burkholderiales bacterium]|nr:DUF2244 domain-containing protein [Burkholderiales bacterium]
MDDGFAADHPDFSLTAKRNCSLQGAERWRAFWILAVVSGLIGSASVGIGAWPIVPFTGLELAALYVAFRRLARDAGDYERVTIRGDRLIVESHTRGRVCRFESNRYWTQVVVRKDVWSCQIALRSHGREIEFGTLLSEGARLAAARRLQDLLRVKR